MHVDEAAFLAFVGDRFKAARNRRRWSRRTLARRSGVSYRQITYIEHGNRPVSITTYFNVARTLGVVWADLFPPYGVRRIHHPKPVKLHKAERHDYVSESNDLSGSYPTE